MENTSYLYGTKVNPSEWATMPYKEVLELKWQLAYDNITELHKAHWMKTDMANVHACTDAMKFNETLLKELK